MKKKTLAKLLGEDSNQRYVDERISGLFVSGVYSKKSQYSLKYCPVCVKEHGIYLIREHQVPEIDVCAEHKVVLKKFPYKNNWGKLNFIENIPNDMREKEKAERVETDDIRYQLACMVHEIFQEGFGDSPGVLKAKIRKRLQQFGYLSEKNYFIDFQEFYNELECEKHFQSMEQAAATILNGIFATKIKKNINPIYYLFFIVKLFGSLESYYQFSITEKEIGNSYYYPNYREKLFLEIRNQKKYLTTEEYGKRYGKKGSRVRQHCLANKIEGAVKLNKIWFVPEDAPYPEDRRFKNHSSDWQELKSV